MRHGQRAAVVIFLSILLSQQLALAQTAAVDQLLGVWHLARLEAVRQDGSTFVPFGSTVSGQLVYSANGQMLVAWSGGNRRKAANPSRPTPEDIASWFTGFDAYWGTFEVGQGVVTHHVKGAVDPSIVGTDRVRTFELRGAELILTVAPSPCWWQLGAQCAPGEPVGLRLTWQR